MAGEQFNLEKSIEPFFGFDKRALHFFNSNYSHTDYTSAVNSEQDPTQLLLVPAVRTVLLASNYDSRNGMADDDVHNQYADFIVKTALFHREIDKSSLMGSGMVKFKDSFTKAIQYALFEQKIKDITKDTRNRGDSVGINNNGVLLKNADNNNDVKFSDIGLTNESNFFDFIVGHLFMIGKIINNPADINSVDVQNTILNISAHGTASRVYSQDITITLKEYLSRLVGNCSNDGTFDVYNREAIHGANYCLVSYFNDRTNAGRNTEAAAAIREIAERLATNPDIAANKPANQLIDNVLGSVANAFINCTVELMRDLFVAVDIKNLHAKFQELSSSKNNELKSLFQDALATLKNSGKANKYKECLAEITFIEIKKMMTPASRAFHTKSDANEWSRQVVENVFLAWDKLDSRARTFFGKHLHVFGHPATRDAGDNNYSNNDDVDLMPDGKYISMGFMRDNWTRLNLMKDKGLTKVLFGETLPWLPTDVIKNVFYTTNDKSVRSFKAEKDSIRRLYNDMYLNGSFAVNGTVLALPRTYSEALNLYDNKDFGTSDVKIIYSSVTNASRSYGQTQAQSQASFDEMLEDIVTREIYRRDADGLYIMVNGEKKRPEQLKENCAGTGLGGDNDTCTKIVAKCLLSGNQDDLGSCLEEMKNHNLFSIAHKELNINPDAAVKILSLFQIGTRLINDVYRAESLDDWIERYVNKRHNIRDLIVNNQPLKDYLCGVIDFVNANPAIINNGMIEGTQGSVNDDIHEEDRRMKKELFHRPASNTPRGKFFDGKELSRYSAYNEQLPPMMSGMSFADPYSNTLRGQVYSGMGFMGMGQEGMMMRGGNGARVYEETLQKRYAGNDLDSDLLHGLFKSVIHDMDSAGLPLRDSDKDNLLKGINQITQNEIKLGKLYVMLRTLVDLLNFFKNSCCEQLALPKDISINQIKTRQDTIQFLKKAICDMEDCVSNNVKSQNNVCNNMLKHFGTLFESIGAHQ